MNPFFITCNSNDSFDFIGTLIVFLLSLILLFCITIRENSRAKFFTLLLFIYHTLYAFVFVYLISGSIGGVDALRYFDLACNSNSWFETYGYAIDSIVFMVFPFVSLFNLSFFSITLIFSLISFIGFYYCWLSLRLFLKKHDLPLTPYSLSIMIPSIHYWTVPIGKDAITIFVLGSVLYTMTNRKNNMLLLLFGSFLIAHVRPYVFIIISASVLFVIFFSRKGISLRNKIITALVIVTVLFPASSFFLEHAKIDIVDIDVMKRQVSYIQENWGGGSTIDISNYTLLEKVLSVMFRPLFFDANNRLAFIASIENLVLLIFLLFSLIKSIRNIHMGLLKNVYVRFLVVYTTLMLLVLSHITPNLGTAFRKKFMFLIPLLLLMAIFDSFQKYKKTLRGKASFTTIT